ncbi:glycine cleavage T protein [Hyaloraphidium curvatum]|nr:glycine cleavage T protein [Hyaloraphidium curvatum]
MDTPCTLRLMQSFGPPHPIARVQVRAVTAPITRRSPALANRAIAQSPRRRHTHQRPRISSSRSPATELYVYVHRAAGSAGKQRDAAPPPPLAEPVLDIRVDRSSAKSYTVRAGEYIQIVDIAGRQCSDFLAFAKKDLEEGKELDLDPTVTRTVNSSSYPGPGLYAKYFDKNFRALVEVVRDTVGRHDTFALACTPRYYADMGYPGHPNCTDNFNAALAPHGIAPRNSWQAVNLFYNTGIDAANQIYLDEPWSRPGDYVLFRALSDLVCASSACPDDIDPANGWDPSEIQVRVYPSACDFDPGVALRVTPDADPVLTRRSGFHPRTSALTRSFAEYRGFWLPTCFTSHGPVEEYHACRTAAAIIDLSALRKFEVFGPDALQLINACVTRDIKKLAIGQIVYTALCVETGGMLDDATVFRLGEADFRVVCGDEYVGKWLRERAELMGLRGVWVKSSTDRVHNVAVQGPKSKQILAACFEKTEGRPDVSEIGWFKFTTGKVGGRPAMVSRTGYTGEFGYEVWAHPADCPAVWDALWAAGQPHGLVPLGLTGLDVLRIEAGLVFFGYEFDDQVDPYEAGVGFTVPLVSKADDFVGKTALQRRKAHPNRVLVGLELEGNEPAGHGDCVHAAGARAQVGVVTSGCRSPGLGRCIALARVAVEFAAPGTRLEVGKLDGHMKRIGAAVTKPIFYDPEKKKPRGVE